MLLLAACGRQAPPVEASLLPVRIAQAQRAMEAPEISATGLVRPREETLLSFKTAGVIREVLVESGDTVKAEQILARLETSDVDAQVAQARESLAKAERDLARVEALRGKGMVSAQAEQDKRAEREVARASLAAAHYNRQQATIIAPSAGIVLERRALAREAIGAGQPVVILGRTDRGWVLRAGLAVRDVARVAVGMGAEVTLDAWPGQTLKARVTRIAGASDPRTGTVEIELGLPSSSQRLVAGLVGRVRLSAPAAKAANTEDASDAPLSIPLSALVEGNRGKGHVFVLDGSGTHVRRIEIKTGNLQDDRIEVVGGITTDMKVVSEGAAWLNDGDAVRVLP